METIEWHHKFHAPFRIVACLMLSLALNSCGGGGKDASPPPPPPPIQSQATSCIPGTPIQNINPMDYFPTAAQKVVYRGSTTNINGVVSQYHNAVSVNPIPLPAGQGTAAVYTSSRYDYLSTNVMPSFPNENLLVTSAGAQMVGLSAGAPAPPFIDLAVFPLEIGKTCTQAFGNLSLKDIDGDGLPEKFAIHITTLIRGISPVTVPAGSFPNSLNLSVQTNQQVTLSSNGRMVVATSSSEQWRAGQMGLVKEIYHESATYNGATQTNNHTDTLESRYDVLTPVGSLNGYSDMVYDPYTNQLYASMSPQDPYAAVIDLIDPYSLQVTSKILIPFPIGANPTNSFAGIPPVMRPMAISTDGSRLYVGLNEHGFIVPVDVKTKTTLTPFSTGVSPAGNILTPYKLKVAPLDPYAICVSLMVDTIAERINQVAIYRNGVKLPVSSPSFVSPVEIEMNGSGNTLFGVVSPGAANGIYDVSDFVTMNINAAGIGGVVTVPGLLLTPGALSTSPVQLRFSGTNLYASDGSRINPATSAVTVKFDMAAIFGGNSVVPYDVSIDPINNRILYLSNRGVLSANLATLKFQSEAYFAETRLDARSLVFIGNNRFAYIYGIGAGRIVISKENSLYPQ